IIILFSFALFSEPIKEGDNLESLNLIEYEDQFGEIQKIKTEDRILIFASDMDGTKIAHEVFKQKGEGYLKEKKSIFIGDIHKMPWLISKFIALPKMRKYPYKIFLIKDDKKGDNFNKGKGKLTGYKIENFVIKEFQIISNTDELILFMEEKSSKK
ncbi:MAG: hypothetical protein KDK36_20715, partial [Leptospiraceae bacterium]|nr:hypothetical protein [Leptospiraceae bacterium]